MEVIKKEHFVPVCGAHDNTNLPLCVTGGKHASSICRNACADVLPGLFCGWHNSFGYAHHLNALKASSSTAGEEWKRCYCRTCASLFFCKRGTFSKMEVNVPKWEEFRAAKWMCVCVGGWRCLAEPVVSMMLNLFLSWKRFSNSWQVTDSPQLDEFSDFCKL